MPGWKVHDDWARKMGISQEISKCTNGIIDAQRLEDYPEDFAKYVNEVKIPRPKDRVPWSLADLLVIFGTHDFGKKDFLKREIFPFFVRKGNDYVKAWYLHFILDYLVKLKKNRWMEDTGESVEDCIDKYQKNKAITVFGTQKQLIEVMNFLKKNVQELQKDLNLPKG